MQPIHFNISRLWAFIRKDCSEQARTMATNAIAFYLIMAAVSTGYCLIQSSNQQRVGLVIEHNGQATDTMTVAFLLLTAICFLAFMEVTGSQFCPETRCKESLIGHLCLPVSEAERFIGRLFRLLPLSVALFACSALLADLTRVWIVRTVHPDIPSAPISWHIPDSDAALFVIFTFLCGTALQSAFILGSTYWRKTPYINTSIVCCLLGYILWTAYSHTAESLPTYASAKVSDGWTNVWALGLPAFLSALFYTLSYRRIRQCSLVPSWRGRHLRILLTAALTGLILCLTIPHYIVRHFPGTSRQIHIVQP